MKTVAFFLFLFFPLWAQDFFSAPENPEEIEGRAFENSAEITEVITQSPGGVQSVEVRTNQKTARQVNASQLSQEEIQIIARSLPSMAAEITKAGMFPFIDAEARYYRNPDAAPQTLGSTIAQYAENPYMQFLYGKDIGTGWEYLSHKTNGTTFFNSQGVYSLRIGLQKENRPVPKKDYEKWGELEFVVFSKVRYNPPQNFGEIRLIFYGTDNKKYWNKTFAFPMKQAQAQAFQGGIYSLTLNHLLEKRELEDLSLLFRGNRIVFGKVEGSINSFTFDFRPNATHFYRTFLEYGKDNRYF